MATTEQRRATYRDKIKEAEAHAASAPDAELAKGFHTIAESYRDLLERLEPQKKPRVIGR